MCYCTNFYPFLYKEFTSLQLPLPLCVQNFCAGCRAWNILPHCLHAFFCCFMLINIRKVSELAFESGFQDA